ncbi:MAG: PIN domain nuclease [Betaproteobacteria bacterium]|nr:PIN domain nuclease [Betaproteobacteria bacterium]
MVYVDTSVLVALFLNEPHSVAVADWYAREKGELVAAAWCITEFASANFQRAAELVLDAASGLRAGDALHLACAEAAGTKRMASLDDVLSRNAQRLKIKTIVLRSTP